MNDVEWVNSSGLNSIQLLFTLGTVLKRDILAIRFLNDFCSCV